MKGSKLVERYQKALRNLGRLKSRRTFAFHSNQRLFMDQTTYGLARRALPVRKQLQIVMLIALGAAAILLLGWAASRLSAAPPQPLLVTATAGDASLHLTPSQL